MNIALPNESLMEPNSMRWWQMFGLGAVDGLAIGTIAEALRLLYEKHRIELLLREAAQDKMVGYILNPAVDLFIPAICVVVFAGISALVYRHFVYRTRSLLMLAMLGGMVAVAVGSVMNGSARDSLSILFLAVFAGITFFIFRFWRSHPDSLLLLWDVIGISSVLTIALGAQLIGLFVAQRIELRTPVLWLLCLILVLLVNSLYGTLLRSVFSQTTRNMR